MATRLQRLRRGGVSETFPFAGPAFRRASPVLLAALAVLGLAVRLYPTIRYAVWGSDSGEYIFLTRQLAESGRVLFPYQGWGLAYPYFPGLFIVNGAVHAVLGIDTFHASLWTVPVLAGTIPPLVALLAYRITSDPRVGIVAGAIIAVSALTTITTSHAMPGTLGLVLMLTLLALLPDGHRDSRHFVLYAIVGLALVLTHHLTTYFTVGVLAAIPFYREMTQRSTDVQRLRVEVPLVIYMLTLAGFWWLVVAAPFREQIVGTALPIPVWLTVLLFLGALAALPALVVWKRRHNAWFASLHYPPFRRQVLITSAMGMSILLVILFVVLVRLPGSTIRVSPLALLYIIPVSASLAFLPLGIATVRYHKHGVIVLAFLYAILASLAFAIVTNSHVFFPFRHLDYMATAMAPLLGLGMLMVYDQTLASRIPTDRPRARALFIAGFAALLILSLALSFPPREVLGGFEEGVGEDELAAVEWAATHHDIIPKNATIAADHRVSSLLWGIAGLHPTWDYTPRTYHSENASDVLDELRAAKVPANGTRPTRVDYVLLSPEIEEGVTLLQWENSVPMSQKAIAKFNDTTRFTRVYDQDGVRIYRVNWP